MDMAVAGERSAEAFYKSLSRRFPEHKNLFSELARDESIHTEKFMRLLSRLDMMTYSTEETLTQAYLNIQTLDKTGIIGNLRKAKERAEEASDLESGIKAAVQLEKDTLLFYQNLATELENAEKKVMQEIIRQEHEHLQKVNNLAIDR